MKNEVDIPKINPLLKERGYEPLSGAAIRGTDDTWEIIDDLGQVIDDGYWEDTDVDERFQFVYELFFLAP